MTNRSINAGKKLPGIFLPSLLLKPDQIHSEEKLNDRIFPLIVDRIFYLFLNSTEACTETTYQWIITGEMSKLHV